MNQNDGTKISVVTATIIGMNAMIGSGIFSAPAAMASNVGPAGILAYLFVVVAVWFMAQSFARLAWLYPQEGSFYTYAKQWGGHYVGLLASGFYMFGLITAMGLLARMAGIYLYVLFPNIATAQTLGIILLIALVILNMFGVALSQLGQHILIITTTFPLVVITLKCLFNGNAANLTPFAPYGFHNILKATRVVIFGFFGFESAASLFSIVKDPKKNVPRSLTFCIILVGTLYTAFIASLIFAVPLPLFNLDVTLPETLAAVFPGSTWLLFIVHLSILSAIIGTIHSMIWGSSTLFASLAKKVHSRIALPQPIAVKLIGIGILCTCIFFKDIDLFFDITATFIVTAFILSFITLLTLKKEWESGQNIKTMLGIGTASLMLYFAMQGLISHF